MISWESMPVTLDEAIAFCIQELRQPRVNHYGYDLHPPNLAYHLAYELGRTSFDSDEQASRIFPVISDACWELCRRGLLRPGTNRRHGQSVDSGGYSLTQAGREGLAKIDETALQILQPGALAQTLVVYSNRFGDGFLQKAQEAIRCRDCGAWLASCAMAGAAAEAVLLATAIAKRGDEEKALKEYLGVNGRRATINFIGGQLQGHMQEQLRIFAGIISLWRDDAAHGLLSVLTAANAEESLRQLLHMCQWFEKHWAQLTA